MHQEAPNPTNDVRRSETGVWETTTLEVAPLNRPADASRVTSCDARSEFVNNLSSSSRLRITDRVKDINRSFTQSRRGLRLDNFQRNSKLTEKVRDPQWRRMKLHAFEIFAVPCEARTGGSTGESFRAHTASQSLNYLDLSDKQRFRSDKIVVVRRNALV